MKESEHGYETKFFTNDRRTSEAIPRKLALHGSFHSVSKRHLHRYLDEFAFRHNHRFTDDAERTVMALKQTEGARLSYAQ